MISDSEMRDWANSEETKYFIKSVLLKRIEVEKESILSISSSKQMDNFFRKKGGIEGFYRIIEDIESYKGDKEREGNINE